MNKSSIFLLCLLLGSFSKQTLCVRLILFNRTKKTIKVRFYAHGVSEPDAKKADLLDKDVYVIPDANIGHRIAWAYIHKIGPLELQKIMLGRQYKGKDIFLTSEDDYLITIVGHGINRSNYTETLLSKDEATTYVEQINKINKIKNEVIQLNKNIKKEHSSFFGGNPFYSYLNQLLSEKVDDFKKLSFDITRWLSELQESKRILASKKTRLHGYAEKTLRKIIEMDKTLATFLGDKPEINPTRYEYISQVKLLPQQQKRLNKSVAAAIAASTDEQESTPLAVSPANPDYAKTTPSRREPEEEGETADAESNLEDAQATFAAQQEIKKLMERQEEDQQ